MRACPPDARRQGKLCLVLDLDHTLLNSAMFGEVEAPLGAQLEARAVAEAAALPPSERLLYRMDDIKVCACVCVCMGVCVHGWVRGGGGWSAAQGLGSACLACARARADAPARPLLASAARQMWTKLRPGVREFLAKASRYYQMWIHTNGGCDKRRGMLLLLLLLPCASSSALRSPLPSHPPAPNGHTLAPGPPPLHPPRSPPPLARPPPDTHTQATAATQSRSSGC